MPGTIEVAATEELWLNYGTVQASFVAPSPDGEEAWIPEAALARLLERGVPCARHDIQDRAVPALEELVERHGAPVTPHQTVETSVEERVLGNVGVKVTCTVAANVEEEEVQEVLQAQVLKPLRRELHQEPEPSAPSPSLLGRVQGLVRGFGSPMRR